MLRVLSVNLWNLLHIFQNLFFSMLCTSHIPKKKKKKLFTTFNLKSVIRFKQETLTEHSSIDIYHSKS